MAKKKIGFTAAGVHAPIGYFNYEELTEELHRLAARHPELAHLQSLGRTPEGRELWLLTLGAEPERIRPALWIDGNMHAAEFSGTSVCIAFARRMLERLQGWRKKAPATPRDQAQNGLLYYIMPRISPDGAEAYLGRHQLVRSAPRDMAVPPTLTPRWVYQDLDGDGVLRYMRQEHPAGNYVEHPEKKGLMVYRKIGDAGPFYRLFREGVIEHFDGFTIPDAHLTTRNILDLNRNFPQDWKAHHEQYGAGEYPGSAPESRAILEFATRHPNIFGWVNYHCFGGVYLRPFEDKPDHKMNPLDLEMYTTLGKIAEAATGYRMVSNFHEFQFNPERPIRGLMMEWAYQQRGAISMVCELWDLFKRVDKEVKPFVDNYINIDDAFMAKYYDWDRKHNGGEGFAPWKRFRHPQLGAVEIGGFDARRGCWNPPDKLLPEMCHNQVKFLEQMAAFAPVLEVTAAAAARKAGGLSEIEAIVRNRGAMPTSFLESAKKLAIDEDIAVRIECHGGAKLESGEPVMKIGRLGGWFETGRGFGGSPAYAGSAGNDYEKRCRWVVSGRGSVTIRAGNRRCGFVTADAPV